MPCRKCVERAIRYVECSRTTHAMWRDYYQKWPEAEAGVGNQGDATHQEAAIRDYDYVLSVLREMLPTTDPLRTHTRMWRPRSWGADCYGGDLPLYKPLPH